MARLNFVLVLLTVTGQEAWEVHLLDVKSAFLNVDHEEEVYARCSGCTRHSTGSGKYHEHGT